MADVERSHLLTQAGFAHGFSLRTGGVSAPPFESLNLGRGIGDDPQAVEANHARLSRTVGYAGVFELSQVHGSRIRIVTGDEAPEAVRQQEGDALIAFESGLAVGVRTADCVPVLLADTKTGAVAAVHAGWRGVEAGITVAAVRALTSSPEDLVAALGPHIGPARFEVGAEVAARLRAACPAGDPVLPPGPSRPKPHVDLAMIIVTQLRDAGVTQVECVGLCTYDNPARYYSFRRDGAASGRHLGVIVRR